jgi:hypothetical protein
MIIGTSSVNHRPLMNNELDEITITFKLDNEFLLDYSLVPLNTIESKYLYFNNLEQKIYHHIEWQQQEGNRYQKPKMPR